MRFCSVKYHCALIVVGKEGNDINIDSAFDIISENVC